LYLAFYKLAVLPDFIRIVRALRNILQTNPTYIQILRTINYPVRNWSTAQTRWVDVAQDQSNIYMAEIVQKKWNASKKSIQV